MIQIFCYYVPQIRLAISHYVHTLKYYPPLTSLYGTRKKSLDRAWCVCVCVCFEEVEQYCVRVFVSGTVS